MPDKLKKYIKRIVSTVVAFFLLYFSLPSLISYKSYDVYVETICLLTSVVGAGFYWVGSKE